jgi:hypothetical protein
MSFNFQYTFSRAVGARFFSELGDTKPTEATIKKLLEEQTRLKKIVDEKSTKIVTNLEQAEKQLAAKKAELTQAYEKQKAVVAQLEKEAKSKSFFSTTKAKLIAEKAKLAGLSLGDKATQAILKPYVDAVASIKEHGSAQFGAFPEYYEYEKITHTLDLLRRELTIEMIQKYQPTVICFQEGFYDMPVFLERLKIYRMIYRDPNAKPADVKRIDKEVDVNAIFYNPQRLHLESNGMLWLNDKQQPFHLSWGANTMRTCAWGHFKDIASNNFLWIFNTHLDHKSQEARKQGALLIANFIKEKTQNELTFLIGDFNVKNLQATISQLFTAPFTFIDAKNIASQKIGPQHTLIKGAIIDYFLVANADKINVLRYEVIDFSRGGLTPSDHRAVILDFEFK